MSRPTHHMRIRVYYEDTDFSGVVYHANYLRFLERGRTEFLRDCGIDQSALHGSGDGPSLAFAVRGMTLSFQAPARMDDMLDVETRVSQVGGASVEMAQAISRDGQPLVSATVRIALVGGGKAQRFPAHLASRLRGS